MPLSEEQDFPEDHNDFNELVNWDEEHGSN